MADTPPLVTLIGGGGFVGRYAAQALLGTGARVRIAERDPRSAFFVRPLGGLGQTQFVAVDIRDKVAVSRAVAGSDAIVNLVGVLKGDFDGLHVDGARNVADAAAATGAKALVQISAIGADPEAQSAYGRSKGEGEMAVRAAFSPATILRPSIVFGREDDFVNRFARMARFMPVLPVVRGATRFQPVWASDLGHAIAKAALDPISHGGRTYEIGGPQILTMKQINEAILAITGRERALVDIPDAIAASMARFGGWAPGAPMTWDQWLMLQQDNVVAEAAEGLSAFGIDPAPLGAVAPDWLTLYRRNGRFAGRAAA